MRGWVLITLAGCGGSPATPPVDEVPVVLTAPAAGSDDFVVASVNGRPVWSSCITAQAAVADGEVAQRRDRALHECVDFELLAQAAEARGLARDPSVATAHHTELVSRLIARDFEDVYKTPADLKGAFDAVIAQNAALQHQPEFRASAYVRVKIPDHPSPEVDAQAHALADRIAAAVADRTGLFAVDLFAVGDAFAKDSALPILHADTNFSAAARLVPSYGAALFALPEVGRTSAAVRVVVPNHPEDGGYEVILWTDVVPAKDLTHEQLVTELFPEARRRYFTRWVDQIARDLHVEVTLDLTQLTEGGS